MIGVGEEFDKYKNDTIPEFIKNYKLGDLPEVIIDKIIIGKRKENGETL